MNISVLMSVYRSEKSIYLKQALNSVWDSQSLRPYEIVLVKDGPLTPELDAVIGDWASRLKDKLIIITNPVNEGLTKSLNHGLKSVHGDYIARMDTDDISTPDRFKLQAEYLDKHPEISITGGWIQEFNDNSDNLGIRKFPSDPNHIKKYISKASPLAHPSVMMRREIFDDGLAYDERYRTSQDLALWFDALDAGYKIGNIPQVILNFRRDDDVFKRRSKSKAKNELKIYFYGIYRLYGLMTWRYIYPIARWIFRMMPVSMIKYIYGAGIRSKILK